MHDVFDYFRSAVFSPELNGKKLCLVDYLFL